MNINEIKSAVLDGKFDDSFRLLYGETELPRKRYAAACDSFKALYPESGEIRFFSAPGRTEVGGNHTDHQHGCVLAASVNLDVIAVVSENNDGVIRIKSEGYPEDCVDINDLDKKEKESGKAISLIRGVCHKFAEAGCQLKGFNAYTISNVLKGSGLSSSAAFEVLIGTILNGMFFDNKIAPIEIAKIGQFAERDYFDKPCGLLDQMASSMGGFTYADFNDPANPITESVDLDITGYGYSLCFVETGGDHTNLTPDYAGITLECKAISEALGVEFLRDANEEEFYSRIPELREKCGDRAILRAFHFFHEQKRVEDQKNALKKGDFEEFLKLVNASGQSSFDYLQNLYSLSDVSMQGIPLGIAFTKDFLKETGACRVHGGGFAGAVQCYVPTDKVEEFKEYSEKFFGKGNCHVLSIRPVGGYEVK